MLKFRTPFKLFCALIFFANPLLAADQQFQASLGESSGSITANSKNTYSIDMKEKEGLSITILIGTGTNERCFDDIDVDLIDPQNIGLQSRSIGIVEESKSDGILHFAHQADTAGKYQLEMVRSYTSSPSDCPEIDFIYDIHFKKYQNGVQKVTEAITGSYSDELDMLEAHEYFFTLGKKSVMTATMSAKVNTNDTCYSDLNMKLFDSQGFVREEDSEGILKNTFDSSAAKIEFENGKVNTYRLVLKREMDSIDRSSRRCSESSYEYNLALDIPGAKVCTLADIKKKCRKRAKRKCKKKKASNLKACMKPIRKRCKRKGAC